MTEAEKAYESAERLITDVIESGAGAIDFSGKEFRALEVIPPQISEAKSVIGIFLMGTEVSDLSPMASMTGMEELYLNVTQVSDISHIAGMTGMKSLALSGTQVSDISHIAGMTGMKSLYLSGTQVSDISPIAGMTGMTTLNLSGTQVMDLRPVRGKQKLVDEPFVGGLNFLNTPACRADTEIDRISKIKNNSERARALFDYLEDWVPPPDPTDLPPQSKLGFGYDVDNDGLITYRIEPLDIDDPSLAEFHGMVSAEAFALKDVCQGGRNLPYKPLGDLLERYHGALKDDLRMMLAPLVWKLGSELRLTLKTNAERKKDDLDDMPPLGVDLRNALDALVQSHNVFCTLHPVLVQFDSASIDPLERHKATQDRAIMEAAVEAFARQVALLREEIIRDMRDLHAQARSDSEDAFRAMKIEQESLENLIKAVLIQGIKETKDEGLMQKIGGDLRGWAVGGAAGAAATALGPEVATHYPTMVAQLQPQISALLSALHGKDYPMADVLRYITQRVRNAGTEPEQD